MMKSEIHWYQVMATQTDLRVPSVYFSDFSKELVPTNYFIMEFIPGTQKDEMDVTPEQKAKGDREIAGMIAKLHRVKGEKFGYIQCGLHDSWYLALRSIVENLIRDGEKVNHSMPRGEKLLELIDRHREILEKVPCRLISFDAWDPNFICTNCDPEDPEFAWIDPERCLWGDPMMDFLTMELGNWNLSRKTRTLAAYNAVAEFPVSGTREEEIRYAFGLCYLAGIVECEKHYRYSPGLPNWDRSIEFSDLLYEIGFSMLE
jgi:aminoglycoside phosphotransferase (APT) family kinase protein